MKMKRITPCADDDLSPFFFPSLSSSLSLSLSPSFPLISVIDPSSLVASRITQAAPQRLLAYIFISKKKKKKKEKKKKKKRKKR